MSSSRLFKWRVEFASIIEDNVLFVVASSFSRAYSLVLRNYGKEFLDKFLLEIKFHSVL